MLALRHYRLSARRIEIVMKKLLSFAKNRLANDGWLWSYVSLWNRAIVALRSVVLGRLLQAPGIVLNAPVLVRGRRHIGFGKDINVGGRIWIEAISQYGEQRFAPRITLGDSCSFSDGVHISCIERIEIGDGVLVGSNVYIGDHSHGIYGGPAQSTPKMPPAKRPLGGGGPVVIKSNVWIGDNVVIVGPVTIGAGAVIGANTVVRRDVAPASMVAGTPAKVIKSYDSAVSQWIKNV